MQLFEMTFWRAIFLICLIILKYRDKLDITKTLPAGIIAFVLSFAGNIALVQLKLISYNPKMMASKVFGVSLFQQISAGILIMIIFHYLPKKFSHTVLYLAGTAFIVDMIVYVAHELKVIKFIKWGLLENFIFDFVAFLIIYALYQLLKKKYPVAGKI